MNPTPTPLKQDRGLTLDKMNKIFNNLPPQEDMIIKKWQYPFLWLLWFFNGYTTEGESYKMWWVQFRGCLYLIKDKEL